MDPIAGLRGGSKEFRNVAIARAKKKKKDGLLSNGAVLRRSLNVASVLWLCQDSQ